MAEIFVAPRYELVQDTMAEIFLSVFVLGYWLDKKRKENN